MTMKFETFRNKTTGVIVRYPAHYANHPVFGDTLELYVPGEEGTSADGTEVEEFEEDKVVIEDHTVPVEQRVVKTAKPKATVENKKED